MNTTPLSPADLHRRHAAHFIEVAEGVADWDAPTPVAEWTARDVVRHLTEWLPAFLSAATDIRLPDGPSVDTDPVGAFRSQTEAVQTLLEDPATPGKMTAHPQMPPQPLDQALTMVYAHDVFLHTWDLARSSGQDDTMDPDLCAEMVDGMAAMEDLLRSSGQYGPRVPVPDDSRAQDRLIGFIGRDPHWRRPSAG